MYGVQPGEPLARQYTSLSLTHAAKAPDAAIAKLIRSMPELRSVNLKGCTLAGTQAVEAILKLEGVNKVNLKGTSVKADHVRELLDAFGSTLVVFKIDNVVFPDVSRVAVLTSGECSVFSTVYRVRIKRLDLSPFPSWPSCVCLGISSMRRLATSGCELTR